MINRIDVSCDLYSNLVTRPTGAAVRLEIEHQLDEIGDRALAILDFSHVRLLDFSCADEIVAKLLLQYVSPDIPRREVYFIFFGMSESHLYAIDAVLERHGLALVTQLADGNPCLVGVVDREQRQIWEAMSELGSGGSADVATASGLDPDRVKHCLDDLWRRRLVIRQDDSYLSLRGVPPAFSANVTTSTDPGPVKAS
jgi:hypothetical protein